MAQWQSRLPEITAQQRKAMNDGLLAAALVYTGEEKRALAGGYTTGAFVTGNVINSVTYQREAVPTPTGMRLACGVNIGNAATTPALVPSATGEPVTLPRVALSALAWELGHQNLFTRRYERVETWRPVLEASAGAITAAFWRVFNRRMAAGAGGAAVA